MFSYHTIDRVGNDFLNKNETNILKKRTSTLSYWSRFLHFMPSI